MTMVTLLSPPTPRTPPKSHSDVIVTDHEVRSCFVIYLYDEKRAASLSCLILCCVDSSPQKRMEAELAQLLIDIRRIGPTYPPGTPHVLFGELFDDDDVQQYYEALVGTLKCAKKRGVITFKGQMLLKGIHDNVQISIVEFDQERETQSTAVTQMKQESPARPARTPAEKFTFSPSLVTPSRTSPVASKRKSDASVDSSKDSTSSPHRTFSKRKSDEGTSSLYRYLPSPQLSSPVVTKQSHDIAGTFSDGEAEVATRKYDTPPMPGACSDSEVDGTSPRSRRARRGRVMLPPAFLQQQSAIDLSGRPPAPWRIRKAQSSRTVTQGPAVSDAWTRRASTSTIQTKPLARKKEPLVQEAGEDKDVVANDASERSKIVVDALPSHDMKVSAVETPTSFNPGNTKENDCYSSGNIASSSAETSFTAPPARKSSLRSKEASFRADSEVHRLVKDICRVGSNPGEPSVTFGELFDDEAVQQTYEALVGTLRSAKRQGFIKFQGQMLFKGMHDNVTIYVVEEKPAVAEAAA